MPGRLVLHVGAMKSGTTFIQSRLFANKAMLRSRGVLVPGREWLSQVYAAKHLLEGQGRMWEKHAARVSEHDGTSVISMEYLGPARPAAAARVRETVAGEIEVVITARDLNRSIAAMWQETLQNGRTWTWQEYLDGIVAYRPGHREAGQPGPETGRTFWRQQNLVRMAQTWGQAVGPENVTVLTVPHPGAPRDLLWERFASVLGTDPEGFAPAPTQNESLGAASALVMRRLNELLEEAGLPFPAGTPFRKGLLSKTILAGRKSSEPSIGLPVAPWVRDHAREMVEGLQRLGVRLVGDWAELEPVEVPGIDPATVPEGEVTEAAVAGLSGLLADVIRRDEEERAAAREAEKTR
ncbi:hypothetical protein [Nocardioides campestrisoli]|uniref:hypothetical protein n=1 Tax=Nocardioides campestrisoli TaxID=2736757 RepID=UPI0015E6351D|nr:hypothetical protein [Nocardioides campestrisoli]